MIESLIPAFALSVFIGLLPQRRAPIPSRLIAAKREGMEVYASMPRNGMKKARCYRLLERYTRDGGLLFTPVFPGSARLRSPARFIYAFVRTIPLPSVAHKRLAANLTGLCFGGGGERGRLSVQKRRLQLGIERQNRVTEILAVRAGPVFINHVTPAVIQREAAVFPIIVSAHINHKPLDFPPFLAGKLAGLVFYHN